MMRPKEVLQAWHQAFVSKDVEALCDLYADDAVNHQVADVPIHGKAAIRENFTRFFELFPDERTEVVNLFEDGEWAIWEWVGGPKNKPEVGLHGCGFFQVRGGKIILQRGYWDKATLIKIHG